MWREYENGRKMEQCNGNVETRDNLHSKDSRNHEREESLFTHRRVYCRVFPERIGRIHFCYVRDRDSRQKGKGQNKYKYKNGD